MSKTGAIHYFSGTGNTHHAATVMQHTLEQAGMQVSLINMEHGSHPALSNADVHVIMFPLYALAAPAIVRRYLKQLPQGAGARMAVVSIQGDSEHTVGHVYQALDQMKRMLTRQGYSVFLTQSVGYPVNWVQFFNPPPPEAQQQIIARGDERIKQLAASLLAGQEQFYACAWGHRLWSWSTWAMFTTIGRRFLGKLFIADHRCNACGKCVKICPVQAIKLVKSIPRWNYQCENCQRCINICPQQAIQTSLTKFLLSFGVLGLAFILLFLTLRGSLGVGWAIMAGLILAHVVLIPLDVLLFWIESVPCIKSILAINFTSNYRRYLAPGFLPALVDRRK